MFLMLHVYNNFRTGKKLKHWFFRVRGVKLGIRNMLLENHGGAMLAVSLCH